MKRPDLTTIEPCPVNVEYFPNDYHQQRRVKITGPTPDGFPKDGITCCRHQIYSLMRYYEIEGYMFWSEEVRQ